MNSIIRRLRTVLKRSRVGRRQCAERKLIFDVGMNTGCDTEFYLEKGFSVLAIEANPSLCESCESRLAQYVASGRLTIVNAGIASRRETLPFYVNRTSSEWSSFDREIGKRGAGADVISVNCVPLSSLLREFGNPYYLHIDIEGNDDVALMSIAEFREKPCLVSVENGNYAILEFLERQGYDRFKFVNQAEVWLQVPPIPAREGGYVKKVFGNGSSGLFGEEAPGPWLSYQEVKPLIERYWKTPQLSDALHGWFDLHARLAD